MAKLIIFSAPSGSGKSTIINYLLKQNLNLAFSISATSRPPRGTEQHGVLEVEELDAYERILDVVARLDLVLNHFLHFTHFLAFHMKLAQDREVDVSVNVHTVALFSR